MSDVQPVTAMSLGSSNETASETVCEGRRGVYEHIILTKTHLVMRSWTKDVFVLPLVVFYVVEDDGLGEACWQVAYNDLAVRFS